LASSGYDFTLEGPNRNSGLPEGAYLLGGIGRYLFAVRAFQPEDDVLIESAFRRFSVLPSSSGEVSGWGDLRSSSTHPPQPSSPGDKIECGVDGVGALKVSASRDRPDH
jgi:hypothetical protein